MSNVAAMRPRHQEERKLVTVLFADVVGSTRLSGRLDPEEVREQMARFFGIAREEIERFGGTIEKFIGDAVMAVFGLPTIHEDDAVRAVHAAIALRTHLRPFVQAEVIPEIRIGVNTGEVVANPEAAEKGEFLVTGEVVNLAARLQQHAQPGQILVGAATHAATRWAFDYRPPAALQVKGKAEKLDAYECVGAKAQPGTPRGLPGVASALVGREAEMAALTRVLERLQAGGGGVVMLVGEPGIGKSRLSAEMRSRVAEWPLTWLAGRTLSIGTTISYWPILEIIRSACGIVETDSHVQGWAKLEERIASVLPDSLAEIAPYLGTLLGLEITPAWRDRVQYLDGEAMGRQIYRSTRLFFAALAREQPLVLMIEDLHWIDQSSAALLEHLLPLSAEVPVLFLWIARPGLEPPVRRLREAALSHHADRFTEIALQPLPPERSDELVRNLLQIPDLPPRLRQLLIDRSEGNPFFVEEVVRALIDLGVIVRDAAGHWQVAGPAEDIAIPDTLRGVIAARIDRLDDDTKYVLKTASVIGRSFFYRVLVAIAEAEVALDRSLDELQRLELIRERRRLPELEYTFKHALTQEATYDTILLRVRRTLHRRVAQAIEELYPDRLEEFFGLLAYHYARAEEWERAQAYLFKAGDQAVRMAADAEGLAYYRQATVAYARVFGDKWDPLQRALLHRKMGEALFRRGEHQQAIDDLQRALGHLGHPFPAGRWAIRGAIVAQLVRQVGHRLLPGLFLRHPPDRPAPPETVERARIYEAMGWIDYFLSTDRLILEALLLLNVSERHGFAFGTATGSMGLGLICDLVPLFGIAGNYHRRAVAVAEQTRHPLAIGLSHLGLALHDLHTGAWDDALAHFQRSASTYRGAGELRQWGASSSVQAWVLRMRGEFAASMELDREMLRVGMETADPQLRGWGLTELGNSLWQTGRPEEAIPHLSEAKELFAAVPDDRWVVEATSGLGMCYLRLGRLGDALGELESADGIIRRRGFTGFLGSVPRGGLIEAYVRKAEEVPHESSLWLQKAARSCREYLKQCRIDVEAAPTAFRWQGTLHWLHGRRRGAREWWQRSAAVAERLGARYDLALTRLEMGRRENDELALRSAEQALSALGVQMDGAAGLRERAG